MLLDYKFSIIKKNNVSTLYVDNKLLDAFLGSKIHVSLSLEVHYYKYF